MTNSKASELSRQLSENVEAVCRHYLSRGHRSGRYWVVGDVSNSPGASLYVRLVGPTSGKGARGKWTDAATAEHGDLIDLIRLQRGHGDLRETLDEVRDFLRLPRPMARDRPVEPARDTGEAARRLFGAGRLLPGTPSAAYLRSRGIEHALHAPALRHHPCCYHRPKGGEAVEEHPALLAAITSLDGAITGISRTWLAADGRGKAALADPRRALGSLLGNGVRFSGSASDILVAGEGIESVLSVHRLMPSISAVAGLSASHLSALTLPAGLRRLYIARDADEEGERAYRTLKSRAEDRGVLVWGLVPREDDFNTDLRHLGPRDLALHLAPQLDENDAVAHLLFEHEEAPAA